MECRKHYFGTIAEIGATAGEKEELIATIKRGASRMEYRL